MIEIVRDWMDLSEKRKDFDKSHFLTMFNDCRSLSDLEMVCSYFNNSSALVRRIISAREMVNNFFGVRIGTVESGSEKSDVDSCI